MINAIKDWLKSQFMFFLRGAIPLLFVILFSLFAVTWLPEKIAMNAIWSTVVIVGLYILLRKKR
ncbi:hypothetical protein CK477_15005 [Enterobacter cloacae]|nr:hypothetical protein CK477_15005 [Enterobacter cloacae]